MKRQLAERGAEFKRHVAALPVAIGRILFPPVCAGCRKLVGAPGALCPECWGGLRHIERPWCAILGTPFPYDMGEGAVSPAAIADPPPFDRLRSAVVHAGVARKLVHGLKYSDRTDLAPWMARWMLRAAEEFLPDADMVVPVPLHRWRFLSRRFNQSAELARTLSQLTGKPFHPEAVIRVKSTRQQVGLGKKERDANVRGAFRVPASAEKLVRGRRILVVDDVYTTGATVAALAKVLKRKGATGVDVLTFARVLPGDFLPEDAASI